MLFFTSEQCGDIQAGPNQNITMVTDGLTSQAIFQSDPGFSLSYRNNVTCHGDSTWDGPLPVCGISLNFVHFCLKVALDLNEFCWFLPILAGQYKNCDFFGGYIIIKDILNL